MDVLISPAHLLSSQAPQVLVLVYLVTAGWILPALLNAQRTVRDGLRPIGLVGLLATSLMILGAGIVLVLLVAVAAFFLPGVVLKAAFTGSALLVIGGAAVFAWPLRRRTLRWLRDSPATETIDDPRLQVLADRSTIYVFAVGGLVLTFTVIGLGVLAPLLPSPGGVSGVQTFWSYVAMLGSGLVAICGIEILQRVFPDATILEVCRRGGYTTRLVDLCDRCFSREIRRAPEALRAVYTSDAEKKLAAMAKALHRSESDSVDVRTAIRAALTPSLSLGGEDVVHRLGSGTPSLKTDLVQIASFLAVSAGAVTSVQFLAGVIAPFVV